MDIELSNHQVLNAFDGLSGLMSIAMPPDVRVKIIRLARVVEAESRAVVGVREEVNAKYRRVDADGKPVPPAPAELSKWQAEVKSLLDAKVTLSCAPLTLDDVSKVNEAAPGVFVLLGPLLVDDEQDAK